MSEKNKIPNRQAICEVLMEKAAEDKDIVVLCSDSRGSASLAPFAEAYPEQFVEVGIAEQDLVSISAGLARCGKKPFCASPASFLTTRSYEQAKVDCAYSNTNVKLIGISGGVSYGALGMSHHSAQDIAAMAALPNMRVYLPSDRHQTKRLIEALLQDDKPAYIRVGRNPVEDIYTQDDCPFVMDKATVHTFAAAQGSGRADTQGAAPGSAAEGAQAAQRAQASQSFGRTDARETAGACAAAEDMQAAGSGRAADSAAGSAAGAPGAAGEDKPAAAIIACGEMVRPALDAAAMLAGEGIAVTVLDMYCVKPLDTQAILEAAEHAQVIVTAEEHSSFGGLGSMVSQVTAANCPRRVINLALPDAPVITGTSKEVFDYYGLNAEGIADTVRKAL